MGNENISSVPYLQMQTKGFHSHQDSMPYIDPAQEKQPGLSIKNIWSRWMKHKLIG